jgi:hypothetical protein
MIENCWIYKGNPITEEQILEFEQKYFGFTYCIYVKDNLEVPKEIHNKIYVGKKQFTHKTKKKLSKKAKQLPENKGKRVLKGTKNSGWLNYYGSSKELNEQIKLMGEHNFKRKILEFATNKSDLALKEIEAQVKYNVLRVNSYNLWIGGKVYKRYL